MVARGVGCGRVPPRWKPDEQDAGDPKGPPNPSSAALAPTNVDGLVCRLMPLGLSSRSPWKPGPGESFVEKRSDLCPHLFQDLS